MLMISTAYNNGADDNDADDDDDNCYSDNDKVMTKMMRTITKESKSNSNNFFTVANNRP